MVSASGELVMSFSKKEFRYHFNDRPWPISRRTVCGCDADHGTTKDSLQTPDLATHAT